MSYKVELIPEAQDDFYKLDNSQRLHVKKSLIKLENQGMLAGYNPGNLVFSGNFQYHLENAGKIHYTISGGLYSNTTTTNSVGSDVGIGGVGSVNVSVSSTSSFVRNILYHGNRYY